MDIKINNDILESNQIKKPLNMVDYRLVLFLGALLCLLIGFGLYKFRVVLLNKTNDGDFMNIYDIFVVVLIVNVIIATLAISNYYYRISIKGVKGQRGLRGDRGEQGDNAQCNVYAPRLIKFKPEERPGKNIENIMDPSNNTVNMDDKNKMYGVHYGWFPVEKKDIMNTTVCKDIKGTNDLDTARMCNETPGCRYRNGKCFKKQKKHEMKTLMGAHGCVNSGYMDTKCYDTKSINLPNNKPINGAIVNSHNLEGDIKAIQFMFDDSQIPSEDTDNTKPLELKDVCMNTGKTWNRNGYTTEPKMLSTGYCKKSERQNVCSGKDNINECLNKKCDWVKCSNIRSEDSCNGNCVWNSMRRICEKKAKLDDDEGGKCLDTYVSKCKEINKSSDTDSEKKKNCVNSGCFWDGKCHDTYFGSRKDNEDHENYDFKCQPNSAIYKIETISSSDRSFGKGDLKPGVLKGIKFYCRDITTGKHTQIYDKNNFLNDYIVIGKEPKPDEKRFKYDSVQCDIHIDDKNRNYPGFISNINAIHGNYGINALGVNLCSYFKGLK